MSNIFYQKWYPYRDNIVYEDKNNNDKLLTTECDNCSSSDMSIQHNVLEDKEQVSYDQWKTQKGKRVVLIEPDNPWYINNGHVQIDKQPEGLIDQYNLPLNELSYGNAEAKSSFMLDPTKLDLGYGHSYADRLGKPCVCLEDNEQMVEGFEDTEQKKCTSYFNFPSICSCLLCIIILLLIIRFYLNGNTE